MNKLRINKFGILSVAKIQAVMMLVMSLLISIPYGLIFMAFGGMMMGATREGAGIAAGGSTIVIGLVIMIGLPIFYGVMGFVFGAIGALLYNLFAKMVGGIEIEVENTQ